MHRIIPAKETPEQLSIRLQIERLRTEYNNLIEPLVKRYAALQMPPSYMIGVDEYDLIEREKLSQHVAQDSIIKRPDQL